MNDLTGMTTLPTPEDVESRIDDLTEATAHFAINDCATALNSTDRLPVIVKIGDVSDAVYRVVMDRLSLNGWQASRCDDGQSISIRKAT